jgi:serine/threonine protein kinase
MPWPLSQDYNEAVQNPASAFSDPELKRGEVVTNPLGIPLPYSGNFADVYQMRCPDGSRWAVKCFTREVPGLHERYQEISRHLWQAQLPFTVDFTFQEQGIRIGGRWYPLLKMQWIEGLTLNEFVRQYLDKPAMLDALLQIWGRLARRLRDAGIAHGDLQHGNLLLVPSGSHALAVKLIDYDGMYVPALAGRKSEEVGHPSYQHPQRVRERIYGPEVDRLPLLLIAAALHCVKVGGRPLWEKYDNGDNLMFREADLLSPVKSRLFYEILKLGDPTALRLVNQLIEGLKGGLESVPLLEEALPELYAVPEQPEKPRVPATVNVERVQLPRPAPRTRSDTSVQPVMPPIIRLHKQKGKRLLTSPWFLVAALAAAIATGIFVRALLRPSAPSADPGPPDEKPIQVTRNDARMTAPAERGKEPIAPPRGDDPVRTVQTPKEDKHPAESAPVSVTSKGGEKTISAEPREDRPAAKPAPNPIDPVGDKPRVMLPDPVAVPPPTKPAETVAEKPAEKPSAAPTEAEKASVPDEAALAEAIKEIKDTFKDDYARMQTGKAAQALAAKLIETGRQTKDDRLKRFALYREARNLAARAAAPALSLQAVEAMAGEYPLDLPKEKIEALRLAGKALESPSAARAFLDTTLPIFKDALEADEYDRVAPLFPLARQAVQVARDAALKKTTEPFLNRMERLTKRYDGIKPAMRTRKDRPDDPEANRVVGAFWCLDKEDWQKGLPLLARADETALAQAARKELARPTVSAEQTALGDAWFELAPTHAEYRPAMQQRAALWYMKALPDLKDSEKERVENRVLDLTKSHPERRPAWEHLDLSPRLLIFGDAYIRVGVGQVIAAKKTPGGSIEITAVLRTVKNPPRLEFLVAGHARIEVDMNNNQLWVRRKANPARGQRGEIGSGGPFTFVPNEWYTITCRLSEDGLEVRVGNRLAFREKVQYNLPRPLPVQMGPTAETLEVRSFTVKPFQP